MSDAAAEAKEKVESQQTLSINQFYLKNAHLDVTTPMHLIEGEYKPEAKMDLDTQHVRYNDTHFAVEVKISISVAMQKPLFDLKLTQGGLFVITGCSDQQLHQVINSTCPDIVFPYVRQAVTNITSQAGFPAINLSHYDFASRYRASLEQAVKADAKVKSKAKSK